MATPPHAPDLPGWTHTYSGKVRDLYVPADGSTEHLLVVTSNRVSAFDAELDPPIPHKGAVLTALSTWWFSQLPFPNHLAENGPPAPDAVADRAMVTRRLEMFPIECVVRGALTGSGFAEYQRSGNVCGVPLPSGLEDGDLLEEPVFTPAWKAPLGQHDENISFARTEEIVGAETAAKLRQYSLDIFVRARTLAQSRGLILADTKFEFGLDTATGEIVLADEVLTSDSSRYWDAHTYETSTGSARLASFDKQIVRDWLDAHWDRIGKPPKLPATVVEQTMLRYLELYERLTGTPLDTSTAPTESR